MEYRSLPRIDPVRPVTSQVPPSGEDWSYEFKYDGFRGLFYIGDDQALFWSRQNKILHQFDSLAAGIKEQLRPQVSDAIIDGELITKDKTGRPIFSEILHRRGSPSYAAFDLLWLNGSDLRKLPLGERRKALRRLLPRQSPFIEPAFAVEGDEGRKLVQLMEDYDLEGVVAKRLDDPYAKRTKWYKIKNRSYSQAKGRKDFFDNVRKRPAAR